MFKLGAIHLNKHTGAKHTATVIFFHGSGATGEHMKEWIRLMLNNFSFPHVNVMYPTAPLQPYTYAGGQMSNVWFDRTDLSPDVPEQWGSLDNIEKQITYLIENENKAGVTNDRIVVGGFSMGGALALHTAYRWHKDLAGVFAFGSFLNKNSKVFEEIKSHESERLPPLLQIHGDMDDIVDLNWAKETFSELKKHGVNGEFHIMERLGHSINKKGMILIKNWIEKLLLDTELTIQ